METGEACGGDSSRDANPRYDDWISIQRNRRRQTKMVRSNLGGSPEDSAKGSYGKDHGGSSEVNAARIKEGIAAEKERLVGKDEGRTGEAVNAPGQRARLAGSRFSQLEDMEDLDGLNMEKMRMEERITLVRRRMRITSKWGTRRTCRE